MDSKDLAGTIRDLIAQFMPLFKAFWIGTVFIGVAMVITALVLKKNPERKKAPWIVGSIGATMVISSCTQLLFFSF
jgi:hypothetical protein